MEESGLEVQHCPLGGLHNVQLRQGRQERMQAQAEPSKAEGMLIISWRSRVVSNGVPRSIWTQLSPQLGLMTELFMTFARRSPRGSENQMQL